jgi:tetratricopeptide (TPR) repeat protein
MARSMFPPVRRSTTVVACLVAAAVTVGAAAAHAQEKDNKVLAKEHFQRGTSFYDLGRYPEAIKEFEAAYHLKNDPAFLYNLAQSYRLAGNAERALHFYRTYLRYVPKAANRPEIEERIKALEEAAAKGTPPPGATTPPPVGPGPVTPPPTTTPPATTGTTTTPPPAVPPPATPPPATSPPVAAPGPPPPVATPTPPLPPPDASLPAGSDLGRKLVFGGKIALGVGGGMILIGMIQGLRAVSAANDVEEAASNGGAFDPAVEDRGKSAESAQYVWLGLGALVGAGGAAAWYYGRRLNAQAEAGHVSPPAPGTFSFAPIVSRGRTGAFMQVRF